MKLMTKCFLWVATALLAAGCAGTKFVRPADGELRLGSTTEQQVLTSLGKPFQEVNGLSNGKTTRTLNYAYASFGGQAKNAGVTPVHGLTLVFHEGKLVSKIYVSNLKEDATDFDDSKVSQIQIGKTTATQVKALLGSETGNSIYPSVKQPDGRAVIYQYQEVRGFTPSNKVLIVVFDGQGTVTDVDYKNQGTWK